MSFPLSFHQAIIERRNAKTVKLAERKKKEPTQSVSPIPGTADVAFHRDAYICKMKYVLCTDKEWSGHSPES